MSRVLTSPWKDRYADEKRSIFAAQQLNMKQAIRHQRAAKQAFPGKNTPSFDLPSFFQAAILRNADKPACAGAVGSVFD
jgi:hypothetical protein